MKAPGQNYRVAMKETHDLLANSFEAQHQFKTALIYRNGQVLLSDSLLNESMTEYKTEMQTRFET